VLLNHVKQNRPVLHVFGHIHPARGAQVIGWPISDDGMVSGELMTAMISRLYHSFIGTGDNICECCQCTAEKDTVRSASKR